MLAATDDRAVVVEEEVTDDTAGAGTAEATQDRVRPRDQLGHRERLDQVVVSTPAQPVQPVVHRVAGCQHQYAGGTFSTCHCQEFEAVPARHHHVQDHQIGSGGAQVVLEARAVGSRGHVEPVLGQGSLDGDADDLAVVDDEDPGGAHPPIVRCWAAPPSASPAATVHTFTPVNGGGTSRWPLHDGRACEGGLAPRTVHTSASASDQAGASVHSRPLVRDAGRVDGLPAATR